MLASDGRKFPDDLLDPQFAHHAGSKNTPLRDVPARGLSEDWRTIVSESVASPSKLGVHVKDPRKDTMAIAEQAEIPEPIVQPDGTRDPPVRSNFPGTLRQTRQNSSDPPPPPDPSGHSVDPSDEESMDPGHGEGDFEGDTRYASGPPPRGSYRYRELPDGKFRSGMVSGERQYPTPRQSRRVKKRDAGFGYQPLEDGEEKRRKWGFCSGFWGGTLFTILIGGIGVLLYWKLTGTGPNPSPAPSRNAPDAPRDFLLQELGADMFGCSWTADVKEHQLFNVALTNTSNQTKTRIWTMVELDTPDKTAKVIHLAGNNTYGIRVQARIKDAHSAWSNIFWVRTENPTVPSAPTNIAFGTSDSNGDFSLGLTLPESDGGARVSSAAFVLNNHASNPFCNMSIPQPVDWTKLYVCSGHMKVGTTINLRAVLRNEVGQSEMSKQVMECAWADRQDHPICGFANKTHHHGGG